MVHGAYSFVTVRESQVDVVARYVKTESTTDTTPYY